MFQDMGSNPANMQSGKAADCYGCLPGHITEQADAEQAYVQAELKGTETRVAVPPEAWPDHWYRPDGTPKHQRPVVRLLRALCGHPDAGTFLEARCDKAAREVGFEPIKNWPSCYHHGKLQLFFGDMRGRLQDATPSGQYGQGMEADTVQDQPRRPGSRESVPRMHA